MRSPVLPQLVGLLWTSCELHVLTMQITCMGKLCHTCKSSCTPLQVIPPREEGLLAMIISTGTCGCASCSSVLEALVKLSVVNASRAWERIKMLAGGT